MLHSFAVRSVRDAVRRGGARLASQPPRGPKLPSGPRSNEEREGGTATRELERIKRPERWKVVLYNDDYTPMEFVTAVLEQVFEKPPAEATQIMLKIHRGGKGIAGLYILEVAETKVTTVHRLAEDRGYPLRAGVERE
jgi:ATP-dependent Clp protease adaptor protein ClpS